MLDFSVTFIITIINIAILFFILRALLFKPVTKFMEERAKRVQDSIEQAGNDKLEARKLLAEYENKLKQAEAEAQKILTNAHNEAARRAEYIIAEGKAEAKAIVSAAHKQLETEHQTALAMFRLEASALVLAASSKLAAREFSDDDSRRYVNMLLEKLSEEKQFAIRKGSS